MNTTMPISTLNTLPVSQAMRSCPLCRHGQNAKLLDLEYALFDDTPLNACMQLVSCSRCGFIYYDTTAQEADFDAFYRDHYFIHAYSTKQDYQADQEYIGGIVDFLRERGLTNNSRIIDVGCGQGQLLRALKSYGFQNSAGVELCRDYIEGLQGEGYEAYLGSALQMPKATEKAAFLIYKHIFEHFFDLHAAVAMAGKHLAPGGYLLAAVPDAARYHDCPGYSPLHYLTLEHINHFDLQHLDSLFGAHGMQREYAASRMLDIAEDFPFPIMTCIFKKQLQPVAVPVQPDFTLADEMLRWLEKDEGLATAALEELRQSGRRVYVWGVSYRTAMYLAMSPLRGCNIRAFLDIDPRKQQKTLLGKSILSPNDVLGTIVDDADVAVVIGVGPSSRSMMDRLANLGFKGTIIRLL